jgi:hypothetical protein
LEVFIGLAFYGGHFWTSHFVSIYCIQNLLTIYAVKKDSRFGTTFFKGCNKKGITLPLYELVEFYNA